MKKITLLMMSIFLTSIAIAQTTLNEGFETWPPTDWEIYLEGPSTRGWRQDFENISHTGDHSADSNISNNQMDNWLVSPPITVISDSYELKYWELSDEVDISFYDRSSIHISSGSPDPADGDYVEVYEANILNTADWEQRTIDLSAYNGETIYVAFRHQGTYHNWFVDDVTVAPSSFSDAGLLQFISPIGVSETPGIQPVEVQLQNFGTSVINTLTIDWDVNNVSQTAYTNTTLNLQPGQSTTIVLGNFDFNTEGAYDITAEVNITADIDTSNNQITTTYDISSFKDGGITAISPGGMIPTAGNLDVFVTVENFGFNTITVAEINWSVNDIAQTPFVTSNLNLAPGESTSVNLGNFAFAAGLNDFVFTLDVLGDTNAANDEYIQTIPVETFWESFEGPVFPPEGWSINFGVRDDINFDEPVEGNYYYASQPGENFFGVINDTLYTPLLEIENGDRFKFFIKTSLAQSATHTLVWKDGTTGEVNFIANIANTPGFNTWEQRDIDISAAAGINRIGIVSTSSSDGLSKFDLFTSDASLYQFDNDLKLVNGEMQFYARQNTNESFSCQIKNTGINNVLGADYTVKLMEAPNIEVASANGVDINSLEELTITVNHSFSDISQKRLYFEIDYANDDNDSNNAFREVSVSIVPSTIEINTIGELETYLFTPFTPGGNTNSLGEDDLTESMYYANEFSTQGNAYGVAYKYDNLLLGDNNVTEYPLQVWISQTTENNLEAGWTDNEDLTLVFDGVVEIQPGFDNDLYIPFDQPILLNGTENVVIRSYQYDPEFPPSILRFIGQFDFGQVRSIGALDVFNLDPENPPVGFFEDQNFSQVRFLIDPITSNAIVSGTVFDEATNNPIPDATVAIEGSSITAQTDANGEYSLPELPFGAYNFTVTADGYLEENATITLDTNTQTQDFFLEQRPELEVSGVVYGDNAPSTPLETVEITLTGNDGEINETIFTDNTGNFTFPIVFGGFDYEIRFFMYGYEEKITQITAVDEDIDLGDIILAEEFISPFDVQVDGANEEPVVDWKSPKLSSKVQLKYDFGVESNAYANEPNENVWLGNYYEVSEITTITSVEIQTSIFEGAEDFVTVEIIDLNTNTVIASSEPFLMLQDETIVVDVPNIVVTGDFMAAVHWQNNPETTNFLAVDYSEPDIFNGALIRYPDEAPSLLSDIIGLSSSFLLRVNTLDDGTPVTNNEAVSYNVYRGLASEFPDTSNWTLLNPAPVASLTYVDMNLGTIDANEVYRYAVETLYNGGPSEVTFSNEITGSDILGNSDFVTINGQVFIYPNPANNVVNIKLENNLEIDNSIEILDVLGRQVMAKEIDAISNGVIPININLLESGVYFIKMKVNNVELNKRFIKE